MTEKNEQRFDLFGDPVPANWGERGRPAHVPTLENRNKVRLLVAWGWTDQQIAQSLRISVPTLKKHYLSELGDRAAARQQLRASHLLMVYREAEGGNAGMIKELGRLLEADDVRRLERRYTRKQRAPKPEKLGKKQLRQQAAERVGGGRGGSKYQVPEPPKLVVSNA